MEKYNYYDAMKEDIITWLGEEWEPFQLSDFKDRSDAADYLYDALWNDDAITGNTSYYDTEKNCENYLCYNINLIMDSCIEFGIDLDTIKEKYERNELARFLDTSIRCYVLPYAINDALIKWEKKDEALVGRYYG